VALALLSLAALQGSLAAWLPQRPLAARSGFTGACDALRAEPADFVVVWPPTAAAALAALPADLRAADAVPLELPGRRRYRHIAVIGPAGFADPPELQGAAARPRQLFDEIELARFVYDGQPRILFDLRDAMGTLRVAMHNGAAVTPCDAPGEGGWRCPGRPPWNHVAPTELRVQGRSWPCVWAHPVAGQTLVIEAREVPLGDEIELAAALSDGAANQPDGAWVDLLLEIEQGDGRVQHRMRRPQGAGIVTQRWPTLPGASPATVRLQITTPRDAMRHLGINLTTSSRRVAGPVQP